MFGLIFQSEIFFHCQIIGTEDWYKYKVNLVNGKLAPFIVFVLNNILDIKRYLIVTDMRRKGSKSMTTILPKRT